MTDSAGSFVPVPRTQDCSKHAGGWGRPMTDPEYIWYGKKSEDEYPEDACTPYYHKNAQIDDFKVNNDVTVTGDVVCAGEVSAGGITLSSRKDFDIPHPTKDGWRLRHTCPEGPSNDVYFRGRVTNKTEIILPNYWKKLVDFTTITVNLTPIGAHQNVIVKRIDEEKVYLQSKGGMPINCFFHIYGTRADGERLIPEYEGKTPADYPGNNDEYSVSGYHYDKREVES